MKKFLIFLVILALIFIGVKLSIGSPDKALPSATDQASGINGTPIDAPAPAAEVPVKEEAISADRIVVSFTGYGPGKEEHGTVKAKSSTLAHTGLVFKGGVVFDMTSISDNAGKALLEKDLKSTKFFDVAKYPTATFTVTNTTGSQVKGDLTIKGVTVPVTLPVVYDAATSTYSSTTRVNMELFGIKQTFADKEFVLTVTVK